MICDKCGKDMRSPEHQLDYTYYLCDDCYKKFVSWVNQEDQDVEELERQLQEQKILAAAAIALMPIMPLSSQMLPPLIAPNVDLPIIQCRNEPKGFEGVLE